MDKISIRFYNNKEVRAIWSDDDSRWYYSATDIVRAINNETDYVKAGNYWRWLKKKLAAQGVQPVSDTHEFKLVGPDGKKRVADVLLIVTIRLTVKAKRKHTTSLKVDCSTNLSQEASSVCNRYMDIYSEACMSLQGRYAPKISARVVLLLPIAFISILFCTISR